MQWERVVNYAIHIAAPIDLGIHNYPLVNINPKTKIVIVSRPYFS